MFRLVIAASFALLVTCQTSEEPTDAPHTHPTHPTHPPQIEHTFQDTNIVFYKDLANKVLVLKSDSGCYVTHLHGDQIKEIDDIEKMLKFESEIIHHVRHAHHFMMAENPNQYSSEITTNCSKLYAYHKEH